MMTPNEREDVKHLAKRVASAADERYEIQKTLARALERLTALEEAKKSPTPLDKP